MDHSVARLAVQNEGNLEKSLVIGVTVKGVVMRNRLRNENLQEHFISKCCQ